MKTLGTTGGDLYFGELAEGLESRLAALQPSAVLVLADTQTARLCAPLLPASLSAHPLCVVPAGEAHKDLDSCQRIWAAMIRHGMDRDSLLINLGGGMICDLGGFAASCYQRGIRFVHLPTSLLAMADAAIGGKTGIDFQGCKNYLGSFRMPEWVWIDPGFLSTLPERERRDGLAELVKHAIIGGPALRERLEGLPDLFSTIDADILLENARVKATIVDQDPTEAGPRKALNFGHTIGHALESHFLATPHPLSHGEAVTLGMLAEARIARQLGLLPDADFSAITEIIDRFLTPVRVVIPTFAELEGWLQRDKKKRAGRVGYSLPDRIGHCLIDIPVPADEIKSALIWLSQYPASGSGGAEPRQPVPHSKPDQ